MKNKVLFGALIGIAAAIVTVAVKKATEKKYANVAPTPETAEEIREDSTETKKKIAKAAAKMTSWILTHKDDIEAMTIALSLAAAAFNLNNKVKEGRKVVIKRPAYGSLEWIAKDMIKNNITDAEVNWEDKAIFDIHMKEVAVA